MSETIKIPEEDLNQINQLFKKKETLNRELASIKLAEIQLEERENSAIAFLKQLNQLEAEISKKYGNGVINTDDGTFTPNI